MMIGSFLDKKSIQEITSIFRQRVLYQLASSKDQIPDITVPQQDKINRFLDCFHVHFYDYLIGEDTSQHMDYYRILSKEIKVFNFGKGQKFRKSHYDGLYIILKGSIEETIIEMPIENHILRCSPSTKLIRGKKRPSEQFRMSSIVNMVVGLNRMISCSSKDSLHKINEDSNVIEPNSPDNGQSSRFNKVHMLLHKESPEKSIFSTPRPHESNEKMATLSQLQHPQKVETTNDNQMIIKEDSNEKGSQEYSTPAKDLPNHEGIHENEPPKKLINNLSFTQLPGNFHKISSQKILITNSNVQVAETSPTPQIATFLSPHESSTFSESNEQNIQQLGGPQLSSNSNLSFRQGNSLAFNTHGPLSRMQSSIMLKQPFQFMDNAKRSHKIFYAGDAVNLTKVSESERKYATSETEDCIYLYISKKSMQRAFHEQINQLQFKTSVLEKVFHNVPPNKILKLAYHMYERILYKNQVVYNIGEKQPFFAYIIKSGEVQISEDINESKDIENKQSRHQQNDHGHGINNNSDSENISKLGNSEGVFVDGIGNNSKNNTFLDINHSDTGELQELCLKKLSRPRTAQNTWKADSSFKEVLCSVGESEIFGLEELVKKKDTRYMSAIVSSSKAEFYVLPAEHFNTFYSTEIDSINLWFKQKEVFYEQQRNLLKRMKMRLTSTPQQPINQIQILKNVKKECEHLFQEDEDMFESKLDSLQKNNYLSLTKFGQYKTYTEMQHQLINQDGLNHGNINGSLGFQITGVAQDSNLYSQKPVSTCISLSNLPEDDEKVNYGKRLSNQIQNTIPKGEVFKSQEQQVSVPATITLGLQYKNQVIRISQGETVINKPSSNEIPRQKSERTIQSKLLFVNKNHRSSTKPRNQGNMNLSYPLDGPHDLDDINLESAIPQGQIKTNEYISSSYTGLGQATQASQPNLGRIYNMVKENKVIAKQQLQSLGGEVTFKQPIFEELKSDNLKQALKYVHKHKQLLEARLQKTEGSPERFKSARMFTSNQNSIQTQLHSARGDQYHGLLKKMNDLENHQGNQPQVSQTQQTFGNNIYPGRSSSSTSAANNKLSPHLPPKTIHSRNSLQILPPSRMPFLTSDSSFSSASMGQSVQPQDINIHMRYKRSVEKLSKPYLARNLNNKYETLHEMHKSFLNINNTHINNSNEVHLNAKKPNNSLINQIGYFPNKTSR